ncbi:hypothetical protein EV426DRAFT_562095 [Tirmania nivea]|nr:hypothetical protein EV426DRAFT_562095 [Tirmania nivea]
MPVHHLPPSSISSLTATQVLTHPPSLIKELIENAIDASSTLVSVELANNCLDFLQVKDNGHGILPGGDRECLCRRGWTSKISRWEEIEQWMGGGGTLGFRGEALAAAAEMAGGGVEVTTKVEGERVGWTGLYTRAGELARGSQSSKSAPIGTTVRVMGFLKNLPVRRETAVKSATKHLQQIRRILITYALSHPKIRFSLKVFPAGPKAKLPTDDYWVYSPSKTVQEAIMKIFGKELAGDGIWVEKSGGGGDGDGGVEVQAFLVKVGIDPSSLPSKSKAPSITGGMGFIFVDSRPISCSRPGPFKSLLSLYKNYIRSSLLTLNPDNPSPSTTLDPFIFLNIKCKSPGMYDPNIEPAKDDVLFRNWDGDVLGVVDIIFREVYGELVGKEKGEKEKVKRPQGVDGVDFGVLLAKKPALVTIAPVAEESAATAGVGKGREGSMVEKETDGFVDPELDLYDDATPLSGSHNLQATNTNSDSTPTATELPETSNPRPQRQRRPTWGFSMSTNLVDEDGLDDAGEEYLPPPPSPLGEEEATRKDVSLSNPWVMAKMNASMKDSLSPMRGAGASSLSVHSGGGGGSSSTSGGDGRGAGWARRGLPPAYRMTSTNRNRDAITAFNNGGNSPFPSGQSLGGLHKWISSGVASTSTPASGVVRKFVQQDHEGSSLPIASSTPARERRVDQIPVAGRVRGAAVVEGGLYDCNGIHGCHRGR